MPVTDRPLRRSKTRFMVSSTFADLEKHRALAIRAIRKLGLESIAMEDDAAKDMDVLDSSLQMVRHAAAYVCIIGHRYGRVPVCPERNPNEISLTELEFNEAQRLQLPILLFILAKGGRLAANDVEPDPVKAQKLSTFLDRAKVMEPNGKVERVYKTFNSLDEFATEVTSAIAKLDRELESAESEARRAASGQEQQEIPPAPALYAEPGYIGSHRFLGRANELEALNGWVASTDPDPLFLYEAIGGTGKSMLTWHFINHEATRARADWAGRFWYSFYERGALMADFCQRALAYVTGQPLEQFTKRKTLELLPRLLRELRARPWLVVLDGLERVLVQYHRLDAAQVRDDESDTSATGAREQNSAIRPEDDELLRALSSAGPSKLLLTSRHIPSALSNKSGQLIPGVRRIRLSGLQPTDAEALFRACKVSGDAVKIREYLQSHCDGHPLVIGVLAGLINDYLPDRGNFDKWANAESGGADLNLAGLDLAQKRNHILKVALGTVSKAGRQLLNTLALLPGVIDYPTLSAFNPHLAALGNADVGQDQGPLHSSAAAAGAQLNGTVLELEGRGLLQYDSQQRRYDLHPVVRGVVVGELRHDEKTQYGKRVIDHFSNLAQDPYEKAETLEDVKNGLHIVRTFLSMGQLEKAYAGSMGDLCNTLLFNLEAHHELIVLLRPFFPRGWAQLPNAVKPEAAGYLAGVAALVLANVGERDEAVSAYGASLLHDVRHSDWRGAATGLVNIAGLFRARDLATQSRCLLLALELAHLADSRDILFTARLLYSEHLACRGEWGKAEAMWRLADAMGRQWSRDLYRPGDAEYCYCLLRFWQGIPDEAALVNAEALARDGKNRVVIHRVHSLRGTLHLRGGRWQEASDRLHEAVRMAREVGQAPEEDEASLAIAQLHLGKIVEARAVAQRLAESKDAPHLPLAELSRALGDLHSARQHALTAYEKAWGRGSPYVHRYGVEAARALLDQLQVEIPDLPPYSSAKLSKFPWEDDLSAAIEQLWDEKKRHQSRSSWGVRS